ncbi:MULTISPECIES: hypothetical protein [unclassified Rhizobium]|uniref:hypothetical protein n=1 Tax=unclassified Rhizobium TaxID=2613769 RepID=UPI0013C46317|nr:MULTISPECIES: hypothetical protein [unclassified Rhizobium]
MSFFPILSVNNYSEMLTKLGWYTWGVSIFCIVMLRQFVRPMTELSDYIDSVFPKEAADFLHLPISLIGVLALAILFALIAHAVKLHDRLSDLLRIRSEFDVNYVLYPLAIASGSTLSVAQFDKVRLSRKSLMGATFYAYVSSTKPVIDSHTITQALTNWSWFWICLEAITLLFATATILAVYGAWTPAALLLIACIVLLLLMRFFRLQSAAYAESQVAQVVRDETRRAAVAAEFNAL